MFVQVGLSDGFQIVATGLVIDTQESQRQYFYYVMIFISVISKKYGPFTPITHQSHRTSI